MWIYNSDTYGGFGDVGGTSASSPTIASITNASNNFYASTSAYLTELYSLGTTNKLGGLFTKMDDGNCGVPTSPGSSPPFEAKYNTFGATINSQQQEATLGFDWNECGGWGSPTSTKSLVKATLAAEE